MRGDPADPLTAARSLRDFVSWIIIMLYNHNRGLQQTIKLPGNYNCLWQERHQCVLDMIILSAHLSLSNNSCWSPAFLVSKFHGLLITEKASGHTLVHIHSFLSASALSMSSSPQISMLITTFVSTVLPLEPNC